MGLMDVFFLLIGLRERNGRGVGTCSLCWLANGFEIGGALGGTITNCC